MYREAVRYLLVGVLLTGCGTDAAPLARAPGPTTLPAPAPPVAVTVDAAPALPPDTYPDLGAALAAVITPEVRVIGIGELHSRVDRAQVTSTLARFTAALPRIGDRVSDLIVETWVVDPTCGRAAQQTTAKVEADVKRPAATKTDIQVLAEAARAHQIQPHAMTLTCADYKALAAKGGEPDLEVMLSLTTRELGRIAASAVVHRDKDPAHRPWILVYGGALHNDRTPDPALAEWSYAALADKVTAGRFLELDLIVPELAGADPTSQRQPWFAQVQAADDHVHVVRRNERSLVIILPKTR